MSAQQLLNISAALLFAGSLMYVVGAFRSANQMTRRYSGIYAVFFMIFAANAVSLSWQRTLNQNTQGLLAVIYLVVAAVFVLFTIYYMVHLSKVRASNAKAGKTS